MKRKIYKQLLEWKKLYAGSEALLIEGARRVGKSWIAEEFAKNEYKSYILVDFSKIDSIGKNIFDNYLSDLNEFFRRLQLWAGKKLHKRESLIIFDEVQLSPKARQAIKWLVAEGSYDYIETGSLMSIKKNIEGIVIPSEEHTVKMYPMDFEEFMWAISEDSFFDFIKSCYEDQQPLDSGFHRKAMDYLRAYIIVGGMPQAVKKYIETKDFKAVDHVKRTILELYRKDIYNYAGEDAGKVIQIWDSIPSQLQRHEKRFRIGDLKNGLRSRSYANAFLWLNEAMVVNTCYATTEPNLGLDLNKDISKYKLYIGDTGLLISLAFNEKVIEVEKLYIKLLYDKLEFNKGMLTENLIAQTLRCNNHNLFFFSRYSKDNKEENMEIDFLIPKHRINSRHNIVPIEVKSTSKITITSLLKFRKKYKNYIAEPIIIYSGEYKENDGIKYLPLYMASFL